ncbi:MAG: hypothetical protein ABIA04_04255 [Pseudomonadota bacterium]
MIYAIIFISIIYSIARLFLQAPVFSFNHFYGFLPGPLYDERIYFLNSLLIYRGLTILISILILILILSKKQKRALKIIIPSSIIFLILLFSFIFSDKLGYTRSKHSLIKNLGGHIETKHFNIYYDKEISEKTIKKHALFHEFRYHQITSDLALKPKQKFTSFIYANAKKKKLTIGAARTFIGDFYNKEMHLNLISPLHPIIKHEMTHIISSEFGNQYFGGSFNIGLIEGIAVYEEKKDYFISLDKQVKAIINKGFKPDIKSLFSLTKFWSARASHAYILSGSFTGFLINNYGKDRFKRLYKGASIEEVYHKTLDDIIKDYDRFISKIQITKKQQNFLDHKLSRKSMFEKTCPHTVAKLYEASEEMLECKNYNEALSELKNISNINPNEYRSSFLSSITYAKLDLLKNAHNSLFLIDKSSLSFGEKLKRKEMLADLDAKMNNCDSAISSYNDLMKIDYLPNFSNRIALKEHLAKKDCQLFTKYLNQNNNQTLINNFKNEETITLICKTSPDDSFDETYLNACKISHKTHPTNPEINYYLGLNLFNKENYKEASIYLTYANNNLKNNYLKMKCNEMLEFTDWILNRVHK